MARTLRPATDRRTYLLAAGAAGLAVLGMAAGFGAAVAGKPPAGSGTFRPSPPGAAARVPVIETAVFAVG